MTKQSLLNKKYICITLLCLLFIISICYFIQAEHEEIVSTSSQASDFSLIFSEQNSFQKESFYVAIDTSEGLNKQGLAIHYTLDGSNPTIESPVYTEPILITATDEPVPQILKAGISYHNKIGAVTTKTYFCCNDIYERFSLPIACISIDPEELYDETTGIYTNYSERAEGWIRPAHVEIYNTDGTSLIEQNIGLSISGVTSAMYEIKPFKLDAGVEWDTTSKFTNLFAKDISSAEYSFVPGFGQIDKINSIKLKNGGSGDYYASRLREVVCMRLAREAGLTPVTPTAPVVVFLNGSYYDLMQMTPNYSANNLSKMYSLNEDQILICKDSEQAVVSEFAGKEYLLTADYNDPSVIRDFESTFDKESFFLYYAVEMLTGNTDWPQYNNGGWKYIGEPIPGNPYSDGKIRFLYYDLSSSYRIESEHEIFEDLFNNPLETKSWLNYVLLNPEYKRYFVNLLCDLLATTFDTNHILSIVDEEYAKIASENEWLALQELGVASELAATREESVASLKDKISERIWFIRSYMAQYLGVDYFNEASRYNLELSVPDQGISVQCNSLSLSIGSSYSGTYYRNYPVLIQGLATPGYELDYWLVNGQQIIDNAFFITPDMIDSETLSIEAVCHQLEGTTPIISEISAAGPDDWIELYNPYSNDIFLGTYYLSNNLTRPTRYNLPKVTLKSGDTIVISGKNATSLGGFYMNMNIRMGENFYLNDSKGNVLESVFVPTMLENESYGRLQEGSKFVYFNIPSKGTPQ